MRSPIIVSSHDEDFGDYEAAAIAGRITRLGERRDIDGSLRVAYSDDRQRANGTRRNPSVRIGREFFTTALRDYEDWPEKWGREALQNSIDANASTILCETDKQAEGVVVTAQDDGAGMDLDTVLNKFLVLGGSGKSGAAGSVGGFGKAKELLILPWMRWQVHTRDIIVNGVGIEYEVQERQPYVQGMQLTVLMPHDQTTTIAHAINFIKKCYVPQLRN